MKRTSIWLTPTQVKSLKVLSKRTGARIAALIRLAIDHYIEANKKAD